MRRLLWAWGMGVGCVALLLGGCATAPSQPTLVAAQQSQSLAPLLPMRRFVANADRQGGYSLSPDGRWLMWGLTVAADAGLAVRPVDAPEPVRRFAVGNQGRGGGFRTWLGDSRHVLYSMDLAGDENTQLRVLDTQADTSKVWAVTPARGVRAYLVARGPEGSARFLFASNERNRASFDLFEGDAQRREVKEVARNNGQTLAWLVDDAGQWVGRVVAVAPQEGGGARFERRDDEDRWHPVIQVAPDDSLFLLRVSSVQGRAWALSNVARDKVALVVFDWPSGANESVLALDPTVDVQMAVFGAPQGGPIAAVAEPGLPQMRHLDDAWRSQVDSAVVRALAEGHLKTPPLFTRPQAFDAQARRVILLSLDHFDAAELLWDRQTGTVTRLNTHFPEAAAVLSPVEPVVFTATDGRRIHGYLTRPRGVRGAVPLVVDIHGGPWARDIWTAATYSPRQMLVNRGYAVLQINYRGSAGYGREHLWAGALEYNGRMQQDIAEGVQWAIDQGVADPQRLAVMGASFGGFSVLAQLAQKRHNYRCGINVVGVANWPRAIESWPPYWSHQSWSARFFGDPSDPAQRAAMLRNSPVSYLDQISAPLLVVHGANDIRVLRQDSDDVVAALRQRGHPVEYLLFPDEGHSISKWRNRLAMWRTVEDTLASCLGGRSAGFDFYELMPRGR